MKKLKYEIFPIVENEIVSDNSLELIKGGGNAYTCTTFKCIGGFTDDGCVNEFSCGIFCWQCKSNQDCTDGSCLINT